MLHPSPEYPSSRPFKIFISLLDKWEIGGPLTDEIVLDVFRAIKSHLHISKAGSEDVCEFLTLSSDIYVSYHCHPACAHGKLPI